MIKNNKYDVYFKKYTEKYFNLTFDWRWFKAQSIAESNLYPNAKSPVGAEGIMQIMPKTWDDIERRLGVNGSVNNPELNIMFGVYYDRVMWDIWTSERPIKDRLQLMFSSYNCGLKYLLQAQKYCNKDCNFINCNLYENIIQYSDLIKFWKSTETITYVSKIFRIKDLL